MKTLLIFAYASANADDCLKIAKYSEIDSEIFVVCPGLSLFNDKKAADAVRRIFSSQNFVPDEYLLYFVSSKEIDNREKFTPENLIGRYYTHHNELEIWPEIPSKKRVIPLWKKE